MSTKTQHTPGPWRISCAVRHVPTGIDQPIICHGDETTTCPIVAETKYGGDEPQMQANARLIAAAPELLEALETALNYIGTVGEVADSEAFKYTKRKARAAIAKAKGQP